MPMPPQFVKGYVPTKKAAPATSVPKFVPTKAATTQPAKTTPETPAQKAENATVLARVLKSNGIDPKTASTIVKQFKAQDQ